MSQNGYGRNLQYFSNLIRFPGAHCGPGGPNIDRKTRGQIYLFLLPKVWAATPLAMCCSAAFLGDTMKEQEPLLTKTYVGKLKCKFEFCSVLRRFPAQAGPGPVTNGSGLQKCCMNHRNFARATNSKAGS